MDRLEKRIEQLGKLKQYKNLSKEDLEKVAKERIEKENIEEAFDNIKSSVERKKAIALTEKYLDGHLIEDSGDLDTLHRLVYLEILADRIKDFIETESKEKDGAIPMKMVSQLMELETQIVATKKTIGLCKKEEQEQVSNATEIVENLKSRFKKWINQADNRSNYTVRCVNPECGKTFLIRRRLDKDKDEVIEHPWFIEGGVLFNKELFRCFLSKKPLTDENMKKILNVSGDYLEWIMKKYLVEIHLEDNAEKSH